MRTETPDANAAELMPPVRESVVTSFHADQTPLASLFQVRLKRGPSSVAVLASARGRSPDYAGRDPYGCRPESG